MGDSSDDRPAAHAERVDDVAAGAKQASDDASDAAHAALASESAQKTSTNPSEYDSADSFSDDGVALEREDGDGQEESSVQAKKVDDDEDKKNPQYIPKRGTFYEHDDRTAEDTDAALEELEKDKEKEAKKKIWMDKKERWCHDKFNDDDQAPKSKQELVAIYGYDIRNEDGPPRARRRRRYGRGPNKYTRNWEDEDAYNKAPPVVKKPAAKKSQPKQEVDDGVETAAERCGREFVPRTNAGNNAKNQRVGTGRIVKPNREIRDADYRGFTKQRQYADAAGVQTRNFTNRKHAHGVEEMARLSLNEPPPPPPPPQQQQQQQQGEPKGTSSKRYSSLRQRSLPETSNAAYGYYQGGQAQPPPPPQQQQQAPPPPIIQSMRPQMPAIAPPPVPVTSTPLPPQFGAPFAQTPFMQPPPPPFMPPPSGPPMMNYVQGQPPYAPPPAAFQGYQQPFNPVSQPTEIFQPPGGITYYSTQEQQAAQQRAAPQKRPKAAIPIVPPPPHEPRGRGRISQEAAATAAGGVGDGDAPSTPPPPPPHVDGNAHLYADVAPQQP